ncbi:hypothetical protein BWK59_12740 [Flavobacterium davisii]|uniref:Uncharacterized protein n=1 Tax=Flavobacterium davisii TaxID=2906077 RepID=A0A246GFT9_9FLAO|nr:hypothetical protein [Flavobacterium davisii]OWP83019.1 hypothetical protein BWK59_12740 [Flavobacterium davisii]
MGFEIIETIEPKRGLLTALLNSNIPIAIIKYRQKYLNQFYWKLDVLGLRIDSIKLNEICNAYNDYGFKLQNSTEHYGKEANPEGVVSITLTREQEQEFKQILNQFKEVYNTKDGAVYENPNRSFENAYKLYRIEKRFDRQR